MIYVTTLYGQIIKKERVHMKEQQTETIEIPLQERYMISLKEASAYFHIGIKKMRRMAEDNAGGFALFLEIDTLSADQSLRSICCSLWATRMSQRRCHEKMQKNRHVLYIRT